MGDGAHLGGIEGVSGLCFFGNRRRHDGAPLVRTTFPQITGIDGGEFTSSTPMNPSELQCCNYACPELELPASGPRTKTGAVHRNIPFFYRPISQDPIQPHRRPLGRCPEADRYGKPAWL
jgi:hypothetical protein